MTPEDARLRLLGAGFCPTPCLGKKAILNGWTKNHEPTAFEIKQWTRTAPAATNTGILTRTTPAFDIDILDPDAAAAIEQLVRDRFEERGDILVRVGFAPKRCILFRTDTPFRKIEVNFVVTPGAKVEKLEFLGDGQQFVAFGVHPDTGRPYSWSDREPGELKREDLPYIHEEEARALVAEATELLIRDFDYRPAPGARKAAAGHSPPGNFAPRKTAAAGETTAYGQAALDRTCDEIRNAGPGQRDAAIGGNVLAIGSLIGGGEIDEGEALDQLLAAAEVNGGDFNEQRDKITRAVATGKKNPKSAPDDTVQSEPTSEAAPDTPQDTPQDSATPEAKAFQAAATLKAKGMSYDDVRDALIGHDDSDIVAWAHEEGLADDEKGLHAAYDGKRSAGAGAGAGAGGGAKTGTGAGGWRKPDPLPTGLLPVDPFNMAFLPASIAPWVADIAERMQCPVDFVAIPAMTGLATVIGRKVAIRPQRNTDWSEVANLWALVIGPPGSMKSPAMAEALKPLRRLEIAARENNKAAMKAHEIAAEIHKLRTDAAKKNFKDRLKDDPSASPPTTPVEPIEPTLRRYITDDFSYEKLGEIMIDNPNGVLAYRDELMSLLRTLDREENAAARGFLLNAWGGKDSYTFDRIIRGTLHIEAVCASLLGATQPDRIADFVNRSVDGAQGGDGMIQRFALAVWPDKVSWNEVDRYADTAAKQVAFEAFQRLDKLNPYDVGAVLDPFDPIPYLKFGPEAQEIFSTWHRHLEVFVLRDDELSPALMGHFSKYKKLVPALALINHLVDGGYGDIGCDALTRAINFSRYLETHARRIYAAGSQNETTAAKAIMTHIRQGDLKDGFTAREVQRRGWSTLTNIDQVKTGLELLVDLGWLAERAIKPPGGGRPTATYTVNPHATDPNL